MVGGVPGTTGAEAVGTDVGMTGDAWLPIERTAKKPTVSPTAMTTAAIEMKISASERVSLLPGKIFSLLPEA